MVEIATIVCTIISKPERKHRSDSKDLNEASVTVDDKQADGFDIGCKGGASFYEKVSLRLIRRGMIPVELENMKSELHLTFVSAYLQACFVLKNNHECVCPTTRDMEFLFSVAYATSASPKISWTVRVPNLWI